MDRKKEHLGHDEIVQRFAQCYFRDDRPSPTVRSAELHAPGHLVRCRCFMFIPCMWPRYRMIKSCSLGLSQASISFPIISLSTLTGSELYQLPGSRSKFGCPDSKDHGWPRNVVAFTTMTAPCSIKSFLKFDWLIVGLVAALFVTRKQDAL
jgi:hypothetical protein